MSKDQQSVESNTCYKHIPASAALSAEGADYVRYFCGDKCYQSMVIFSD